jgi:peptidoglycan hydrolase-like protein with peptidoglycan-binding domain
MKRNGNSIAGLVIATLVWAMQPASADSADRDEHYPNGAGYSSVRYDPFVRTVQLALEREGYYVGDDRGEYGAETRAAINRFERANGLPETATITLPVLEALGLR